MAWSNNNIERQQLEIMINTRQAGTINDALPYDPTAAPDDETTTQVVAQNLLDNSDFDFSKNGYINSGAGDDDYECYNWYRQRFIKVTDIETSAASNAIACSGSASFKAAYTYPMDFVLLNGAASGEAISGSLNRNGADEDALLYTDSGMGTPLNVDNSLGDAVLWFGTALAESDANALKSSSHSLYAANEGTLADIPIWERTNGWVHIGSDTADAYDIACPLPINFVRAGLTYYFKCIVALNSAVGDPSAITPVRLSAGVWDATTAEKRFIESSNMDLSAAVVGTTGATSYQYRIIADLDDGTEVASDLVTVANGNATLSSANYIRLTWENAVGILNFRIYRSVGGVVHRIFTIRNGGHDYNDYGTNESTEVSMPTAAVTRPIAYKVSPEFTLDSTTVWTAVSVKLEIPSTYDTSATTGKQWVRIGVEGNSTESRSIALDRVMLSTSNGGWQRSARDLDKILTQNPTSLPTSSTQGGTGIISCFVLDTPVIKADRNGSNLRAVAIEDIDKGDYVFSGAQRVFKVIDTREAYEPIIIKITMSNGVSFTCSPSERFITSRADRRGTRIDALTLGDTILGWDRGRVTYPTIELYQIIEKETLVKTLVLKGGHTFVVGGMNGIIAHNLKMEGGAS